MSALSGQSLAASQTPFHAITGQFHDQAVERRFRAAALPRMLQDTRLALFVAAIVIALFGFSDYIFLGPSRPFYLLMALRAVMITGCLALAGVLHVSTAPLTRPWLFSVAPLLIATGTMLIVPLRPHTLSTQFSAVMLIVAAFYLVIPNLLWGMIGTSLYLTAGFLLCAWYWAGVTPAGAIPLGILLLVSNLVGYVAAVRRARLKREQFLLIETEQRTKQRLMDEIARREALEQQLRVMAQTDELTGLHTRRHFMERAQEAFAAARQQDAAFSLCMLDVDNFKLINDRWGHVAGDRVLRTVADACRRRLHADALIGRFGGEEFVAALAGAHAEDARGIAEQLRETISTLRFDGEVAELRVTMTVGLSTVQPQEADFSTALRRADAALYQGKRRGGDIVLGDGVPWV